MGAQEAFDDWAEQYDAEGNKYMDMGADEFFIAGHQSRQPEIDALKASLEGCEGANKYNKAVIREVGKLNDALKAENERLKKEISKENEEFFKLRDRDKDSQRELVIIGWQYRESVAHRWKECSESDYEEHHLNGCDARPLYAFEPQGWRRRNG